MPRWAPTGTATAARSSPAPGRSPATISTWSRGVLWRARCKRPRGNGPAARRHRVPGRLSPANCYPFASATRRRLAKCPAYWSQTTASLAVASTHMHTLVTLHGQPGLTTIHHLSPIAEEPMSVSHRCVGPKRAWAGPVGRQCGCDICCCTRPDSWQWTGSGAELEAGCDG